MCPSSSTDENDRVLPWKVFPEEELEDLRRIYGETAVKLVHVVRHAEGAHNVNKDYKSVRNIDAQLTEKGYQQCKQLAASVLSSDNTKDTSLLYSACQKAEAKTDKLDDLCILTSPLTRCIQTALESFPTLAADTVDVSGIPIVAQEAWRETVNYNCDRRRSISEIAQEFPRVDFSEYKCTITETIKNDEDPIWSAYRERLGQEWHTHMESAELHKVAERGRLGLEGLTQRSETQIILCTHSAFLRCILNWGQTGGVPKLMPQKLVPQDFRSKQYKLFEYSSVVEDNEGVRHAFETFMRQDYENCELRSFCLLVR